MSENTTKIDLELTRLEESGSGSGDEVSIGGSRGGVRDARPPWASKFFRFHAVFGKIWRVHAPPGGFTPPPRENPGSATGL